MHVYQCTRLCPGRRRTDSSRSPSPASSGEQRQRVCLRAVSHVPRSDHTHKHTSRCTVRLASSMCMYGVVRIMCVCVRSERERKKRELLFQTRVRKSAHCLDMSSRRDSKTECYLDNECTCVCECRIRIGRERDLNSEHFSSRLKRRCRNGS